MPTDSRRDSPKKLFLRPDWIVKTIWLLSAIYAAFFSWFSLRVNEVFHNHSFDLGNMWQTAWNVAHGDGFSFTFPMTGEQVSRLSTHADYILILLSPLTWLTDNPNVFMILQAIVVAGGAWFVYSLSRRVLQSPEWGGLMATGYVLYGPIHYALLWQFHPVTLAVTFILGAAEAVVAKRRAWVFWMWWTLALLTKEQVGLFMGIGLGHVLWQFQRKREALISGVAGLVWTLVHFGWVIPAARPAGSHFVWDFYYASLGEELPVQLMHLFQPNELLSRLLTQEHVETGLLLLIPWLGAIFHPLFFIAGAAILPHWVSDTPYGHNFFHISHILSVPFMILAGIFGLARLRKSWLRMLPEGIWTLGLSAAILINAIGSSPAPWSFRFQPEMVQADPVFREFQQLRSKIPADANVAFSRETGAAFRSHARTIPVPLGLSEADYIVVWEPLSFSGRPNPSRDVYQPVFAYLDHSPAFSRWIEQPRGVIYKREQTVPAPAWPNQPDIKTFFMTVPK